MSLNINSLLIHGGVDGDETTGAVNVPVYQTSTYKQDGLGQTRGGWEYSRTGNPTRAALEKLIADLEKGEYGLAFASGLAAISTVLSLFKTGDKLIVSDNIYGGTFRILDNVFNNFDITYKIVDTSDLEAVKAAIDDDVKAIYVESPANPLLTVTDIEAVSKLAKESGRLLIVDNTFMTPYFQRPLTMGADIVVHSATKYLCGHNDVVAGIVVIKDEALTHHFQVQLKSLGSGLGPMDSWLIIRGLKTLSLRMKKHDENAKIVAEWLRKHPKVKKVYYVGFEDHPGYKLNLSQSSGFGGMISFELDSEESAQKILSNVKMILFAESLGGTETLITYPITQTHEDVPDDVRRALGINEAFIRISIGIEDPYDIIADLEQALS